MGLVDPCADVKFNDVVGKEKLFEHLSPVSLCEGGASSSEKLSAEAQGYAAFGHQGYPRHGRSRRNDRVNRTQVNLGAKTELSFNDVACCASADGAGAFPFPHER